MSENSVALRDPFLDNAKGLLIVLVVLGHLLETIPIDAADALYKWIYAFHMPAFVLVSGYLSRNFRGTPRQNRGLVTLLLIPYVVVQLLLALERMIFNGADFSLNLFIPGFAIWYLLALVVWRLMTPLLLSIPHPLLISIAVSILSVTYGGVSGELAGARILSFLPFFTLGLLVTPAHVESFKRLTSRLWLRVSVAAFLVVALFAIFLLQDRIARAWLYMYGKVDKFGLSNVENVLVRVLVLAVATVLMFAFLAIVPRTRTIFTPLGEGTIYVYVLQILILYPLLPIIGAWPHWNVAAVAALLLGGIALALLLGTRPVQRATRWLIDPVGFWTPLVRRPVTREAEAPSPR
ncbi:Fucose 4-O-acetylase [Cryobacterium psychrotolerans]|uniref:Fucose 4-O-acetylase n=1 Tax=Cryobacterium psychrotolerans TaxID=386301 RepID=A0A1G9CL75_9MICO|nr:acyltransferase family protein [Cryobacterium psychrotolerans]TFD84249.1 hypothetical protein E3T56_11185 [Cryobacterium psychrotolerans]SDK52417.1 Fucose 4-O-acetylase [Cryobacterium psychrotolerans]